LGTITTGQSAAQALAVTSRYFTKSRMTARVVNRTKPSCVRR
jgi:hypothetical protein